MSGLLIPSAATVARPFGVSPDSSPGSSSD